MLHRLTINDPDALSRELRTGTGSFLVRRRAVIMLSIGASGAMGLITLYQTGSLRHLPEPPLPRLDADAVDAAPEAYTLLGTPDGALGLASYAVTAVLAAMGPADRARRQPVVPLALTAKVGLDVLVSAKLTRDQWVTHRAFCFWCLVASLASVISLPLTLAEGGAALAHVTNRRRADCVSEMPAPSPDGVVGTGDIHHEGSRRAR